MIIIILKRYQNTEGIPVSELEKMSRELEKFVVEINDEIIIPEKTPKYIYIFILIYISFVFTLFIYNHISIISLFPRWLWDSQRNLSIQGLKLKFSSGVDQEINTKLTSSSNSKSSDRINTDDFLSINNNNTNTTTTTNNNNVMINNNHDSDNIKMKNSIEKMKNNNPASSSSSRVSPFPMEVGIEKDINNNNSSNNKDNNFIVNDIKLFSVRENNNNNNSNGIV